MRIHTNFAWFRLAVIIIMLFLLYIRKILHLHQNNYSDFQSSSNLAAKIQPPLLTIVHLQHYQEKE